MLRPSSAALAACFVALLIACADEPDQDLTPQPAAGAAGQGGSGAGGGGGKAGASAGASGLSGASGQAGAGAGQAGAAGAQAPLHPAEVVATAQAFGPFYNHPVHLAADATHVYWASEAGTVQRIATAGGAAEAVGEVDLGWAIALGATEVYVTTNSSPGAVYALPKQGGKARTLAQTPAGEQPMFVAADASRVFFYVAGVGGPGSRMRSVAAAGGEVSDVFTSATVSEPFALTQDRIFWADSSGVLYAPKAGGAPSTLAQGQVFQGTVAADEASVYYLAQDPALLNSYQILRVHLDDGQETAIVSGLPAFTRVAVDATHVYWMEEAMDAPLKDGRILRVPKGGGSPVLLAEGIYKPTSFVPAGAHVYWTTLGHSPDYKDGTVGRAAVE